MRYLVTLAILVASELLYCLVLIGMDARIIGQVNMTGPPVTAWEVARLTALVSATYFAIFAGAFVWLHSKLRNDKSLARCLLPVLYVACWVAVAYAVASYYEDLFGATWVGLEFFGFYFLNPKALGWGVPIVALAYATNHGALRKLGRPFGR